MVELTMTNVVFIMAGVMALAATFLLYMYFNGGAGTNLAGLLGMLPHPG